ncbi:glycosyltransferase family 4 protein [Gelidibacter salicanalis]|uniref:Glycosyltransferase family 4 protein n=1 Tax=Gelidibacter salicanalis TaxID=291193 RepID=A0A934KWC9_9FLAO|nr:glycosyltransferase family 4 protein [Gelidibacter salicanalis]MBJ7880570.1 glycosyltransferase family 4 protein [Gelidibacter salicanalis]
MSLITLKSIAIICNYEIKENRIGGMDRFFIAFDEKVKKEGYTVQWFFKGNTKIRFYDNLNINLAGNTTVEALFLEYISEASFKYSHVITHFTELCSAFYKKVKLITEAKCIAIDHNPRPLEGFSMKKRLKLRFKGLLYSRFIDVFVGVSKYTKRHILMDYGNFITSKVIVVYNGIDTTVFKKRNHLNTNRFIVACHLRSSKGIQDLLRALSLIPNEIKSSIIVDIYGEGPMEKELKMLSSSLNLDEIVAFKGSTSELHNIFCNYNYMIQPTYMECFSLSILESLSANVPVITTQVGGNMEVIKDGINGYIFQAGDINELKVILTDLLNDKKSIVKPVHQNIQENFSIERMVGEHFKLLN